MNKTLGKIEGAIRGTLVIVNNDSMHFAIAKIEPIIKEQMKGLLNWITSEEIPYAILYGHETHRFATKDKDYTIDEIIDQFINETPDL